MNLITRLSSLCESGFGNKLCVWRAARSSGTLGLTLVVFLFCNEFVSLCVCCEKMMLSIMFLACDAIYHIKAYKREV